MSYIKTFTCGFLDTNAFLIGADNANQVILIDAPPDSFEVVQSALKQDKKELEALLITHPHFDHIMDAHKFASQGIPIIACEGAEGPVAHPDTYGFYPQELATGTEVTRTVKDGDKITLAGLEIEVLSIPGHCEQSVGFYIPADSLCFVGDLIFKGSVGSTNLADADFDVLAASIRNKIYTLQDNVVLLPGHGPETSVGEEKQFNPLCDGLTHVAEKMLFLW